MNEAKAYAEERIRLLKEDEKAALQRLGALQGGIAEWEYYLAQQPPVESSGDAAAQEEARAAAAPPKKKASKTR